MAAQAPTTQPKPTSVPTSTPANYILSFYVPKENTAQVMTEVCKSGAGSYPGGLYTEAYWTTAGVGQFRPMAAANPAIGKVGQLERVDEDKVEVVCVGRECLEKAVALLIQAHPYEQVAYYAVKSEEV